MVLNNLDTELKVIIYCAIVLIILFVMYGVYHQQYLGDLYKTYILTSNGHVTFSNDKISLSMYNQHENQSRYIEIEGINNNTGKLRVHSSALRTSPGNTIKPEVTTSPIVDNSTTAALTFDKKSIQPASYEGWLIVSGENSSQAIQVNVSSPPMIPQALIIVGIGSVSSIAFWEFIKYSNRKKISTKREKVDSHAKNLFNKIAEKETDTLKRQDILARASLLKIKTDALYSKQEPRKQICHSYRQG